MANRPREPDVLIVSVRHVPLKEADEVLTNWNPAKQGYVFNIASNVEDVQKYLLRKYLMEAENEQMQ